ncbi:MAG: HlyD family secretion protein [Bdellovibrio sp.]|nr:HlyD family secretion protein [Bdellovibrio sp.]
MDTKKKVLSGVGVVAAIVAIHFLYEHLRYVETDNAQVEAHSVLLAPKVPGFVTKVNVVEGQKVKKDDVLVEIDERDYNNTLRQVKGDLASLEARRSDAEKSFRRISSLYKSGAVSQQQYDTSSAAAQDVRSKYDALSAQVSQAQLNLENTKVKAPSDGYIAKKSVEPGQLASAGVPLIGFVSSESRWVTANFKETDIEDIKVGAAAFIAVDALSKSDLKGTVESISSATGSTFTLLPPDNATGNFTKVVQRVPVKIKIDGLTDKDIEILRAGLSATVKIRK